MLDMLQALQKIKAKNFKKTAHYKLSLFKLWSFKASMIVTGEQIIVPTNGCQIMQKPSLDKFHIC